MTQHDPQAADTERPPPEPTMPAPPMPAALGGSGKLRKGILGLGMGSEERLRLMKAAASLKALELLDRAMRQGWQWECVAERPFTDTPIRAWASHHSHAYQAASGADAQEACSRLALLLEPLLEAKP